MIESTLTIGAIYAAIISLFDLLVRSKGLRYRPMSQERAKEILKGQMPA